jgi:hypothetical protein
LLWIGHGERKNIFAKPGIKAAPSYHDFLLDGHKTVGWQWSMNHGATECGDPRKANENEKAAPGLRSQPPSCWQEAGSHAQPRPTIADRQEQ